MLQDKNTHRETEEAKGLKAAPFVASAPRLNMMTAFVLINGIVLAVVAGLILYFSEDSIRPATATKLVESSPWIMMMLVLTVTGIAAFFVERKAQQDQKIAEMSKTLEGAHHELQTKISERDKFFHALRKSERENRALINSVSDVIFETDENGKVMFLNETWKRITHQETAEAMGRSLFSMIDVTDQARQKEMFEELVRGERQAYRIETRLNLGHDMHKPVEIAFSMLRMAEDKSIRVVGTITDIEKRRRAEMAVREAEQRFRAIFENSISGIYQTSPDGRFISANPALAEILGYDSTEDMIMSVDICRDIYLDPEDRKAFVQKLLFEGRVTNMETQVRRRDGKKIWIMESARVVRTDRGGVSYYEGSVWDVTERKEAEEAMRQARLQAEISSRSRMEFLANMSHELRTPLNAVIGFSEIIKDEVMGSVGTPAYKEYAKDIYDSGNYLLKVISEILEVSKIESGNRELNINNFHLSRAMKSCMIIIGARSEQAGVGVKLDLPTDLPELLGEELGFKQVMLNLIGNAIKFTPRNGSVSVTAYIEHSGDMVIDVVDTGIGMTEEEIVKAMQPFSKVDASFSGMKEGTGLGLTIVDSIVRLHGGSFRLISQKGVGTTARVVMPAHRVLHNPTAEVKPLKIVN
jgi:PAS domain S-box-containing protein